MARYVLLDTDVYSYLSRGDPRGNAFRGAVATARPCLSFATVAELYKGAAKRGWRSERVAVLETHLKRYVMLRLLEIDFVGSCVEGLLRSADLTLILRRASILTHRRTRLGP